MVEDLHLEVEIDTCPTIREEGGLGDEQSQPLLDNPKSKTRPAVLWRALENTQQAVDAGEQDHHSGSTSSAPDNRIRTAGQPRLCGNCQQQKPFCRWNVWKKAAQPSHSSPCHIGSTRLIDNMLLGIGTEFPRHTPSGSHG